MIPVVTRLMAIVCVIDNSAVAVVRGKLHKAKATPF